MRARLVSLAERRARLAARAQAERETLVALLAPLDAAASVLQAGRRALDQAKRRPAIIVAGVALLVVLRPRRAFAWLARGWSLWRIYRGASGMWRRFAESAGAPATPAR